MAKVTREVVEKTGIKVDQLVELLVKNAAAELTNFSVDVGDVALGIANTNT
jgi:ferritin-like protein